MSTELWSRGTLGKGTLFRYPPSWVPTKTEMMGLYASSQGTTTSLGERYRRSHSRRKRDFGGSHREYERPSIRTRVSSENEETDGGGSRDY